MAVAYGAVNQLGLLCQQYPPPLLPKPGKDNARLQKLLKRTAKKKTSVTTAQSVALFRSSLSPVNEASPDLEHSDHSTPPKTPETPYSLFHVQPPPSRFTVRPLYQHVASPYPQRGGFGGRPARYSPQMVSTPQYSYPQQATPVSSYGTGPTPGPVAAQVGIPQISLTEATVPATEVKVSTFGGDTHAGLRPAATVGTPQPKPSSLGPTPYVAPPAQAMTRPLTVLTPIGKSKSPRPTFKATERSRSPRPMFDVPQIRMYTASTSYYESSKTPPVYDSAGLTAIGSAVTQSTLTETKQDLGTVFDVRRGPTPTSQPNLLGTDSQRKTPTLETKRVTPSIELKRATPTSDIKIAAPAVEIKRVKTPTSEVRAKTPTYELQTTRIAAGRPRTPAYHTARAATPSFEVSRPNPLLFAVSPINVEPEKSITPQTVSAASSLSASQSVKTTEKPKKPAETILNGDVHAVIPPAAAKPIQQPSITKSKSEPDLMKEKIVTAPSGSKTPTFEPGAPAAVTSVSQPRPKTPTFEASRLLTTSLGYKRPRTPTYGPSPSGVSPVPFQRPKTPTQVAQKSRSTYRGLTPAEYAAYGGIRTYTPAFGIAGITTQTEEEVKVTPEKPPIQEPSMKEQSTIEVPKVQETPKVDVKPPPKEEKVAAAPVVPIIIVSQASDTVATVFTKETRTVTSQVAAKQETTVIQEMPNAKPPTEEVKRKVETPVPVPEVKPKPKTPEVKRPLPKGDDQDPMKAVRKLLGRDKVQTVEQKPDQKETPKPVVASVPKIEVSKPSPVSVVKAAATVLIASEDKSKDKKEESAVIAPEKTPEKKQVDDSFPVAEPLLKVIQKPKGVKSKLSGWSRLKKHMVVEQEEPEFPAMVSQKAAVAPGAGQQDQQSDKVKKPDEKAVDKPVTQDGNQTEAPPIALKMWDAVLFKMFSTAENIMQQIELNKTEKENETGKEKEKPQEGKAKDEQKEIPSFAHRLPVLLFSPKFDAKRLKEAASRPVTKMSTVFEMGLIGRKCDEGEKKDFNKTARGFHST